MNWVRLAASLAGIALTAQASPAFAQFFPPYGWNDERGWARRAPPPSAYDDDDDDDIGPQRYTEQRRDAPPPDYRYERRAPGWPQGRTYAPRGGYGEYGYQVFPDDGYGAPLPNPNGDAYRDEPPPGGIGDGQVADGGGRPDVAPVAPPLVAFYGQKPPGSILIDVGARKLYYVNGNATAYAYPIGVGRQGFAWTGTEKVSRIAEWPDWYPPAEMRVRKPELPAKMTGGVINPLGARAIYLGNTLYRIHGTNDPKSIGRAESSGCFRMMNGHVVHLAQIAQIGSEVTVVKSLGPSVATSGAAAVR